MTMNLFVFACVYLLLPPQVSSNFQPGRVRGWKCVDNNCVEVRIDKGESGSSLARCQLTCGQYGLLWPYPTGAFSLSPKIAEIDSKSIIFSEHSPSAQVSMMANHAIKRFIDYIKSLEPSPTSNIKTSTVEGTINITSSATSINLNTDESYQMNIQTNNSVVKIQITANSYFGARHALQTLSQLVVYDEWEGALIIVKEMSVSDSPTFRHRGILLDTSRHFYSTDSIKRTIHAMSINKLNTLHWHITDTTSFPVYCPSQPNMTIFGATSDKEIYTYQDIRDIVEYARARGVRVLPELDTPYHVSRGFEWTNEINKGNVTVCLDKYELCRLGVPCGHLNPVNEYTYSLLRDLYFDFFRMFGNDIDRFHMGGDEVLIECWNSTKEITEWMEMNDYKINSTDSFHALWGYFNNRAFTELSEANRGKPIKAIVWTSDLTKSESVEKYIDKTKYSIQVWTWKLDPTIKNLLSKGYELILSNTDAWYLDCGFDRYQGGHVWCSPYKTWRQVYDNDPFEILALSGYTCNKDKWSPECDLVLGGEVCMWSEGTDASSVDMKVWPRAAALAERLWSNPPPSGDSTRVRLGRQRERLVHEGISADAVHPKYCNNNEDQCNPYPENSNQNTQTDMCS